MKINKVYLIGAGPGKADLMTVRGARILAQADVVVYDYLVDKKILEYAREGAELICGGEYAHKGRYSYGHPVEQGIIDRIILEKVKGNKKVVRLKNGDPAFFSRFSEELRNLIKNNIEFEVVPGVTAASAASCLCGIPLTDRDHASGTVFVTGHKNLSKENNQYNRDLLPRDGTLVIYMGVANLEKKVAMLLESGKPKETPVAIIKDISLNTQKIIRGTLKTIGESAREAELSPPALIIIGSVTLMERELNWWERNKRVLFTGISRERYFLEGNYIHLPLVEIVPLDCYKEFDTALRDIEEYDWIIFTSRFGVEYFFRRLKKCGYDARKLSGAKIGVVGGSTERKLNSFGLNADLMPVRESSRGLREEFSGIDLTGKKIFLPCSDLSDKGMGRSLETRGAQVTAAIAYKNIMPGDLPDLDPGLFDKIIFTSPSTVRNFRTRYGKIPGDIAITCIGEATEREYEKEFKVPVKQGISGE